VTFITKEKRFTEPALCYTIMNNDQINGWNLILHF
jgi:hypothetical protein